MKFLRNLIIKLALIFIIFDQDTPVNLVSDAISHEEIQLNWNVWDPSDSYYDAIIYITDIQDLNNQTIVMDFFIENSIQLAEFKLHVESNIFLSQITISGGLTNNYGWSTSIENYDDSGNFSITGSNNGTLIPATNGIFFQLTASYISGQEDETSFELNYGDSFFNNGFDQIAFRWKNIIWEVDSGIKDDECGDNVCTINENYSICPSECELDISYKVSFVDPNNLIDFTNLNYFSVNNSLPNVNMVPLNQYCFEIKAIENNTGINQTSNVACSYTQCVEIDYCLDFDGDGLGDGSNLISSCEPIENYVNNCDDENDQIYCTSNFFDFCGVCDGVSFCNTGSNIPGWCQCPNGQDEACWDDIPGNNFDCYGTCFGTATKDDCGICTGGNTFLEFNYTQDCNGTCGPSDPLSLANCDGVNGYNPSQPSTENDCLNYLGIGGGVDKCGICGGNNSACFPYFQGPTNLFTQASNLQIGLSWDPVDLCDPYIYNCDWGDNNNLPMQENNSSTRENEANIDAKISIDQIEDDGQGTVSFYLSLQADIDISFIRLNLDVYDIYDTLSVFQDFPNLEDLAENDLDCFDGNQTCIQFGQPSGGIIDNEDYDFAAYTETNGSATLQSFLGLAINNQILQEGTTLFKMDAVYDPNELYGKDLYVTQTLTIQTESDTLYVLSPGSGPNTFEKANVRFNTSVWQVGSGLASIYSCGDGLCQEPFEEPGNDFLSGSDGYPTACSTALTEYFLGIGITGDCIPPQSCGDGICQDDNYCQIVNGILQCGYSDGAPHEAPFETWEWCSTDCYSCGNGTCDWDNNENYCDNDPNNDVPACGISPIQHLSCSEESFYADISDGVYGDCMEPYEVEYTIYRDDQIYTNEEICLNNNGIWQGQCFLPLISTSNTQYNDAGLDYLENHCYFIMASQGDLTTMNGMLDPNDGYLNTSINGNSNISCAQTNPQIGELPVIREVADEPNDQGGYVKLKIQRSYSDNGTVDSLYRVYRMFESDSWTFVSAFPGTGEQYYYDVIPTLADSIPNNPNYHYFKISYRGYQDSAAFNNFPKFGYSIDNIAPHAPEGLATELGNDEIILSWNPVLENDFSHYVIFRNGNQINTSFTNSYVDFNYTQTGGFLFGELLSYKVLAVDIHGNNSNFSTEKLESYGNYANVSFQDLILDNDNNLNGIIIDSNLVDILDITMAQSIACNLNIGCQDTSLQNPSDYELWASNLNFDNNIDEKDLGCFVYYLQNDLICPINNTIQIDDLGHEDNFIIFNVENINSFQINIRNRTKILNHNLSNDWQFISGKNKIYAYSLLNTEYSGEIQIELSDPKNIQSIFVNSYK